MPVDDGALLRMREVVKRSGVSAQSIRFYIKEGLLPRPRKLAKNSALYDASFVDRVRLIKTLQTERYLPLKVIRDLIRRGAVTHEKLPAARPVARMLAAGEAALLGARAAYSRADLLRFGVSSRDLATLEKSQVVAPIVSNGKKRYGEADARVVRALVGLKRTGLEKLGLGVEDVVRLADLVRLVVRQEIRLFTDKVLGRLPPAEVVALIERVLPLSAQLFEALRARAQVQELELVRQG